MNLCFAGQAATVEQIAGGDLAIRLRLAWACYEQTMLVLLRVPEL